MESLREAEQRKVTIWNRYKEAKRAAEETTDPVERRKQMERARILYDIYKDVCADIARLSGKPWQKDNAKRKTHAEQSVVFEKGEVWSDLAGMTWNELDGACWDDIIAARFSDNTTGRQGKLLTDLLNDAVSTCTQRQKEMISGYYGAEKTMEQLALESGVCKSTVSRVIRRGLGHVAQHTVARLTIASCIEDNGKFDYLKFVQSTTVLTERQIEMLYLALTQDCSYTMIAAYLRRNKSSVSRAMDRMERRLSSVRVELLPEIDVTGIKFSEWAGIDESQLAARLGLSRKTYYSNVCRGETIDGIPLLHYHALCCLSDGRSIPETAKELGTSQRFCAAIQTRYAGREIPLEPRRLPPYTPVSIKRKVGPGSVQRSLRDLCRGENAIIDRVDKMTVYRLMEAARC